MTPREHALRVAVLKTLVTETETAYENARREAEEAFALARADGLSQQKVMLPDGEEIGLISIKAGGKQVSVTDAALLEWVTEHLPGGIEEYVNERDANSADVLDVLRAVFPGLVKRRVRTATRETLLEEVKASGGYLTDRETGDKVKVAEVADIPADGSFAYRPAPGARDKVITAWQRGDLKDTGLPALTPPTRE